MNVCQEETYRKLFFEIGDQLRNFLVYKCKNIQLAEDLVQDAFHTLWVNCKKVTPDKAKSYVFTIGNNLFLNTIKKRKVEDKYQVVMSNPLVEKETPEDTFLENEFQKILLDAIWNLPENDRLVFMLNRIEKKKYREIAEDLNISIKTVEKRMHNALLQLRKVHPKV